MHLGNCILAYNNALKVRCSWRKKWVLFTGNIVWDQFGIIPAIFSGRTNFSENGTESAVSKAIPINTFLRLHGLLVFHIQCETLLIDKEMFLFYFLMKQQILVCNKGSLFREFFRFLFHCTCNDLLTSTSKFHSCTGSAGWHCEYWLFMVNSQPYLLQINFGKLLTERFPVN